MWKTPLIFVTLISAVLMLTTLPTATAQRRTYGSRLNIQQLVRRIDDLERRVAHLEASVPVRQTVEATVMTVEQAERQLQVAQERYTFSQRLLRKGYIVETEFETEEYEFQRAAKVLELAQGIRDERPTDEIRSSIEVLDAEHYLAVAQAQLQLVEKFVPGGFTGPAGMEGYRQAVAEARERLNQAKSAGGNPP